MIIPPQLGSVLPYIPQTTGFFQFMSHLTNMLVNLSQIGSCNPKISGRKFNKIGMKPPASWNQFMWCTVVLDDSWKKLFDLNWEFPQKNPGFKSLPVFFLLIQKKFPSVCGTQISQNLLHVADSQSLAEGRKQRSRWWEFVTHWRRSGRVIATIRDRSWSPNLEVTSSPFKLGHWISPPTPIPFKRSRFHQQNLPRIFFLCTKNLFPLAPKLDVESRSEGRTGNSHFNGCFWFAQTNASLKHVLKSSFHLPPPWTSWTSCTSTILSMRLPFCETFCSFAFLLRFSVVFFVQEMVIVMESHMPSRILDLEEWEVNPEWMRTLERSRNDLCTMRQGIKEIEEVSETMQGKSRQHKRATECHSQEPQNQVAPRRKFKPLWAVYPDCLIAEDWPKTIGTPLDQWKDVVSDHCLQQKPIAVFQAHLIQAKQ